MGDVTNLPVPRRSAADADASRRRERALAIREEISKGKRQYEREAKLAAEELWKVFEERGRDFKRRVCAQVWNGPKPTKRLYGLVWDPKKGQPKAATARKPAALTTYLRLAEAVARVGGEDADDVILRVFPTLLDGADLSTPRDLGPADQLRETFWSEWVAVNEQIAKDCDLRTAFPLAMELPGMGSGPYERFRLDCGQILGDEDWGLLHRVRRWVTYRHTGSPRDFLLGVAPSVFLGECHGPGFRAHVVTLDQDGEEGEAVPTLTAWVRVWVRFWWAILPIGAEGMPRGCFVVTLMTERSSGLWTVTDLNESNARIGSDDALHYRRHLPSWARVLCASGARHEFDLPGRPAWQKQNHHGLALSWDCDESGSWNPDVPAGRYRCTAALDPGTREVLTHLFGCVPEALPATPARILPATANWRDLIFSLPDGALADWVGPDPDAPHEPPPTEPEIRPGMSDEEVAALEDAFAEAEVAWGEQEVWYQRRGLGEGIQTRDTIVIFPELRVGDQGLRRPTIGSKLADSLLRLPEADRPDTTLRKQAIELRDHARHTLGQITGALKRRMASLGGRTPDDQQRSD